MRLFIASPAVIYNYTGLKNDFSGILSGKWVEEENLHLTWIFLGEQELALPWLEKLKRISPLQHRVPLYGPGSFGHPVRILHAGAKAPLLYEKARIMRKAGFNLHRFTPHVTLCRVKKIHDRQCYKELLKKYEKKTLGEISEEIALYESILTNERACHKKLASVTWQYLPSNACRHSRFLTLDS